MNITKLIYTSIALFGATIAFTSCDQEKYIAGGELVQQSAKLEVINKDVVELANPYSTRSIEIVESGVLTASVTLRAHLTMPAVKDTKISLKVDEDAAKKYGKGEVKVLPSSMISIPEEISPIAIGSIASSPIVVGINLTEDIEYDDTYTFAIRLDAINGAVMNTPNDVVIFSITRREDKLMIEQVTRITRDVFFELSKDFSHSGDFTMECLVNVEKFRDDADSGEALISTLMGIEGGTLIRFGDFGSGNKIQAPGYNVQNFTFQPNTWYHIALTYNAANQNVIFYIDGKEIANYTKSCSLIPLENDKKWYIGRSWSNNRGIQAQLSEVRVWTVARTLEQVAENMLEVDSSHGDLLAYWKMNSAEGNVVTDLTGNGYDLRLKVQQSKAAADVNVITLDPALDGVEK